MRLNGLKSRRLNEADIYDCWPFNYIDRTVFKIYPVKWNNVDDKCAWKQVSFEGKYISGVLTTFNHRGFICIMAHDLAIDIFPQDFGDSGFKHDAKLQKELDTLKEIVTEMSI